MDTLTTEQRPTVYQPYSQTREPSKILPMTGKYSDVSSANVNANEFFQNSPNRTQNLSVLLQKTHYVPSPQQKYLQSPAATRVVHTQQPIIHEVHVNDQPIEVVPRWQLEEVYQEKYNRLQQQIDTLRSENIRLRSVQASEKLTINEDTTRVNHLMMEVEKYTRIAKEQEFEIENWKRKYLDFEAQVQLQFGVEVDYIRVKNSLQETEIILRAEINEQKGQVQIWKEKYQQLERKIYGASEDLQHSQKSKESKMRELNNKIALLTTELERVNMLITQKNKDIEKWKSRFNELEMLSLEKDRNNNQMSIETKRLKDIIDNLNGEIRMVKAKQVDPTEYLNQIHELNMELERLTNQLRSKNIDIDNMRQEIHQLQNQAKDNSKYQAFEDRQSKLQADLRKAERAIKDRDVTIGDLQIQIRQLESDSHNVNYVEKQITLQNTEIDNWKKKFSQLNQEYSKAQEALMMAEAELENIKKKGFQVKEITDTLDRIRPAIKSGSVGTSYGGRR